LNDPGFHPHFYKSTHSYFQLFKASVYQNNKQTTAQLFFSDLKNLG